MKQTRREFLLSAAAATAAGGLFRPAASDTLDRPEWEPDLDESADYFEEPRKLQVVKRTIEVNGRAASVFGIVQPDGTQGIISTASNRQFRVRLENQSGEETLVHWHGLTPPAAQDGVPGLSQPLLAPGEARGYGFPLRRGGTFWMHSHYALQEQSLLAAPLILQDSAMNWRDPFWDVPPEGPDIVIMLHDFTFRDPREIYAELTGGRPMADHGSMAQGQGMPMDNSGGMAGMDHSAMNHGATGHLNDVEFDAYLANDRTLDDPEIVRVESCSPVRLRIINGAAATNFMIDLGGLEGELVAVDGSDCRRRVKWEYDYVGRGRSGNLRGRRFPLAMSQRIDIKLDRLPPGAYPILARREGDRAQTGIILATPGAAIARVPVMAAEPAPALESSLDLQISTAGKLRAGRSDRHHTLELTGSMMGFVWGLNGRKFGEHQPLMVRQGERATIEMINRTDMSHPMHLHGHTFQVVGINGDLLYGPERDTVLVPVNSRITIAIEADNPGRWAFHCHNLYHMAAGMMTTLEYET